jgi:hypothetical protein
VLCIGAIKKLLIVRLGVKKYDFFHRGNSHSAFQDTLFPRIGKTLSRLIKPRLRACPQQPFMFNCRPLKQRNVGLLEYRNSGREPVKT